ncbi:hypothetical protein [Ensifer sp.]|jgi:hypothetical protein|uniref:hypothetical protein n=1 Tax=Ensifer sp. TaxID=1872086 RepID=UPI002E101F76|nr:hypothetical protein [Ensifer sp.]
MSRNGSSRRAWLLGCGALLLSTALSLLPDPRFAFAQETPSEQPPKDQIGLIKYKRERFRDVRRRVDEGDVTGKAVMSLEEGNCQIGKALLAIVNGEDEQLLAAMKSAASSYQTAIEALTLLTDEKRFSQDISKKDLSLLIQTQLFTAPLSTQNDLLKQLLALTVKAKAAADRIGAGNGTNADLSFLVDASSKIPRMLMAFIDVVVTS